MKKLLAALLSTALLSVSASAQSPQGLKVFISVDMEGITSVTNREDASRSGKDYDYFRRIMTKEANAARSFFISSSVGSIGPVSTES